MQWLLKQNISKLNKFWVFRHPAFAGCFVILYTEYMKIKSPAKLFVSLAITLGAGVLGSFFTSPAVKTWYLSINRPAWNPPSWLFAPVWTTLFILMGIALYLVWSESKTKKIKSALNLFTVQIVLNVFWSVIFFGMGNFWLAFAEILVLWVFILLTMIEFRKVNKTAGLLLLPYLLWASFASFLNFTIASLN